LVELAGRVREAEVVLVEMGLTQLLKLAELQLWVEAVLLQSMLLLVWVLLLGLRVVLL
jgi:hypothetical protein